jgi:hypothetical protein
MKQLSTFTLVSFGALIVAASLAHGAAVDPDTATSEAAAAHAQQMEKLEARMQVMQKQVERLRQTQDPAQRRALLVEHLQTMREQMADLRALGGPAMHGQRGMGRGTGGGTGMGNGTGNSNMGSGMGRNMDGAMGTPVPPETPVGDAASKGPGLRHRMTEDRLDMMQMMMEQMMEQMQQAQPGPPPAAPKPAAAGG